MVASAAGAWSADLLRNTVSAYMGSAYNQNMPAFRQFCHAAAKVIQRRRSQPSHTLKNGPVIFILEAGRIDVAVIDEVRPRFDCGFDAIEGRIWMGASRLARATGVALPAGTDADRFDYVVNTLGVGDCAAIYYDAQDDESSMRAYPEGLANPDVCEDLSLNASELSLQNIQAILDSVHRRLLITPTASDAARDLWADQRRSIPIGEAEKGVQKALHVALTAGLGFGPMVVLQEGTSEMGRYDFLLKEQHPLIPSVWTYHAILELKVLKSFTEAGNDVSHSDNRDAVTSGVDQAHKYRQDHSCRMAALCCYDMRKTPDVTNAISHELPRAQSLDVAIWAWPLYSTAKQARSA